MASIDISPQARDPGTSGIPFLHVMNGMPLPEKIKLEMIKEMFNCCSPLFRDRTVLIIMLLLTIFDQDGDKTIKKINENLVSILIRYLEEKNINDVSFDMQIIIKCVEALPRLLKIFTDMSKIQEKMLEADYASQSNSVTQTSKTSP